MDMTADEFVNHLEKVRQTGPGRWLACCPAHADKTPSLSVREGDKGAILIYCFAGCSPAAVLESMGLTFSDLFQEKQGHHHQPAGRTRIPASDVLKAIAFEVEIFAQAAGVLVRGETLSPADLERMKTAYSRITAAVGVCHGR